MSSTPRRGQPAGMMAAALVVLVGLLVWWRHEPAALPAAQPGAIEVHFSPNGGCTEAILRELAAAKRSVCIQAYSFTSKPIAEAILKTHERGVKVEAVLDKSNRSSQYSGATFLLNQGIPVLIDDRHTIAHNKVIIVDEQTVITGSFNFTSAAESSNAENLLILHDCPAVAAQYLANFREHQAHSAPYNGPIKPEAPPGPEDGTRVPPKYIGSKGSSVYHYAECNQAKRISPESRVEYHDPPEGKRLHTGCPK